MSTKMRLKKVVLAGRANVGKSTLFNRLSSGGKSLTLDFVGVTRDFVSDITDWNGIPFELIDSGGISSRRATDKITVAVKEQVKSLITEAEVVVFVCDGTVGVLPEDHEIAKELYKLGKEKVILVVNKIDSNKTQEHLYEFEKLGFKKIIPISAQHGMRTGDLLDQIIEFVGEDASTYVEETDYKVVLLGKPNVGKSSLMNLLANKERSIVTDLAGTTREAIRENIHFSRESIELTDTAGVRRKRGITEEIEGMMVKSSLKAVRDANIVLLMVDASEGQLSDQELKLAFYVFEQGKALILLFNKQDVVEGFAKEDLDSDMSEYGYMLDKIEMLKISCKDGKNIGKILPLVKKVWERYSYQFDDVEISDYFKTQLETRPLVKNKQLLLLKKAYQVKTAPPTVVLQVNHPQWFGSSQLAFFENLIRSKFNLKSVPLRFLPRKR